MNLKECAKQLKADIPAVFIALRKKGENHFHVCQRNDNH